MWFLFILSVQFYPKSILELIFFFINFIFERERQSVSGGGVERERDTQNPRQSPGWNSEPVRSWPELKSDA